MRFRDLIMIVGLFFSGAILFLFSLTGFRQVNFASEDINREDARREPTTLLSTDNWIEFQVVPGANNIRVLTNAALKTVDAPDYDLSNPRLGWRYAIEYEILDVDRTVIRKSEYHFRSQVRQLLDVDADEAIYPLFFGRSSLVSSQTRSMQIANDRPERQAAIVRLRLLSADPEIQEVVARMYGRVQRKNYADRLTWNRMSSQRQETIAKYCVYSHELLTENERRSLLHWSWTRCPTIGEFPQRYLFFIGDSDDQEVRDEQIPLGLFMDSSMLATIPIPEGQATLRLEFCALEPLDEAKQVNLSWQGLNPKDRLEVVHPVQNENSSVELQVDGGLLQLESAIRLVVRAFWHPVNEAAIESAMKLETQNQYLLNRTSNDLEITPRPIFARTYVAGQESLEYDVNHFQGQPTPLRLQIRYPFGTQFGNTYPASDLADSTTAWSTTGNPDHVLDATASWEFCGHDGVILNSGDMKLSPVVSRYDWLTNNGMRELVSEPQDVYLLVPANVAKIRIRSDHSRLLVNAFVRPRHLERTIQVPEDYLAFNRIQSLNRSWFGINPSNHLALIRDNYSFVVATQVRPSELDSQIRSGDYEWIRYEPQGAWVGRQMLVPQVLENELQIREESLAATYFEVIPNQPCKFRRFESSFGTETIPRTLVYAGDQAPGALSIWINGNNAKQIRLSSQRGEVDLDDLMIPASGQLEIRSDSKTQFFLSGLDLENSQRYLKRTAQKLQDGELIFKYEKLTQEDELLTLQLYRAAGQAERCKLRVGIGLPESCQRALEQPQQSWTVTDRIYDLRAEPESPSLLLGKKGRVDTGHRCFILLGSELPPGEYTINVRQLDDNSEGFVLLYHTVAGKLPRRNIQIRKPELTQP